MNTTRSITILAVLCAVSALADQTITRNWDMSSSGQAATVDAGSTDTFTGLFTGNKGGWTLNGGGTAVIVNQNNTYSKSWRISSGIIRFDEEGASGTAEFYHQGGSNSDTIKQFQLNAEGATFPNNFNMVGSTGNSGYEYAPLKFMKSCTFAGTVTGGGKAVSIVDDATENPTVSFLGDMSMGSSSFEFIPSGVFKLYGKVTIPNNQFLLLDKTDALGTVELYNPSNSIGTVRLGYTNLKLMEADVLTNATVQLYTTRNFTQEGAADMYLYADQRIKAFSRATNWSQSGGAGVVRAGEGTSPTLTFEGHAEDSDANKCRFAFAGPISLVKTGTGIQDFNYRTSTMTGTITVRGGTFKVSGSATFPNASAVNVENGLLDLNVSTPFSTLKSVSIGSTGRIASSSSTSVMIETDNLKIGGKTLFKGLYTSATHPDNIGDGITIKCNNKGGFVLTFR